MFFFSCCSITLWWIKLLNKLPKVAIAIDFKFATWELRVQTLHQTFCAVILTLPVDSTTPISFQVRIFWRLVDIYQLLLLNVKINVALSENASRTRFTIKIKLKLRNRKVFSCLLKDGSELAEVTTGGRLFHTPAASTPNALSPMVHSLVRGTVSLWSTGTRSQSLECFRLIKCPVQVVGEVQRCRVMSATVKLNC